jgi:hypothetical protein
VPHPAARPGILDRGQRGKQINWHRITTGQRGPGASDTNGDRQRWTGGHGSCSGDRAGVGTAMITSDAVSAPHLPHHRRVKPQTRHSR